ncbi:hypothetical protein K1719_023028 [Acacia pycnantha]|nr:hypothetical protein K1719_023028 [Acacia pycnantha]
MLERDHDEPWWMKQVLRYDEKWRMNKFLRAQLAINIAEDTGKIMANAYKNLTKIPSDDQLKDDLQKAFLTGNMIKTIPDDTCLQCSQLSTLLLNGNANLNYISDDSFKNMPALKILDLFQTRIKRLPKSVSNLKCLTALLLSKCRELTYTPSFSKLKQLILLDLSDTAITVAPMGLESLVNLRCLNLYRTYMLICRFCSASQLVGRLCLSDLEDLKDIVSPDALLSLHQPSLFSHLTHLEISTCPNIETLMTPKLLALFRNLRNILVEGCWKMKEIIGEDNHSKMGLGGSGNLSHPTPIHLPMLTSLKFELMPQLNFIYRGVMLCPSLQTFSASQCHKLHPPRIEISNGCELPMENTFFGYCWEIETD